MGLHDPFKYLKHKLWPKEKLEDFITKMKQEHNKVMTRKHTLN